MGGRGPAKYRGARSLGEGFATSDLDYKLSSQLMPGTDRGHRSSELVFWPNALCYLLLYMIGSAIKWR